MYVTHAMNYLASWGVLCVRDTGCRGAMKQNHWIFSRGKQHTCVIFIGNPSIKPPLYIKPLPPLIILLTNNY